MAIVVLVIGVFLTFAVAAFGVCLDNTLNDKGKPQPQIAVELLKNKIFDFWYIFQGLKNGNYARKLTVMTVFAVLIAALVIVTIKPKKLHRKGSEHGSARWANEKEINKLADSGENTKEPKLIPIKDEKGRAIRTIFGQYPRKNS
jgi:type IV secretion system protein VirD4